MATNNWALGLKAGLTALWNPLRQGSPLHAQGDDTSSHDMTCDTDAVATLAETTSNGTLYNLQRQMLLHPVGRQILREKPLISSQSLGPLLSSSSETSFPETFGSAYARFLHSQSITPDSRTPVCSIVNIRSNLMPRHIDSPH
jgi:ubiquinone biosynthesis protein Coq4